MTRVSVLFSGCLAVLLCTGCAAHESGVQTLPSEPFSGHLTEAGDGTWFTPCAVTDNTAKMWVTFIGAAVDQAQRAKSSGVLASGQSAYVRLSAARTDERLAGPGGPALLVRDIAEIRAARADDCAGK
jgi:hypothetical protein